MLSFVPSQFIIKRINENIKKIVNFSMLLSHANSTAENVERGGTLIVKDNRKGHNSSALNNSIFLENRCLPKKFSRTN